MKTTKSYSELLAIDSFEERYEYLKLSGSVAEDTFGAERYLNQEFYHSEEWRSFRNRMIVRDSDGDSCLDLAHKDHPIFGYIILHHINPVTIEDILENSFSLFDPENVVCVSLATHNAIHYGTVESLPTFSLVERHPGDTKLW